MLELANIKKSFGGVRAVQGSTFSVPQRQVTALIGPNGAGKTTLFDIICGLIKADSGKIIFAGQDITGLDTYKIANLGVSRTFQQVRLFPNLTILDHLLMTENNEDTKIFKNCFNFKKIDKKIYQKILDDFGVKLTLETLVESMSYGQRKLLQIAMALRRPHKILMLDEPVAGVNKVIQSQVENFLLELKKQKETILLIDHDMNFVRKLADQVIALDAGQVIAEGPPEQVLNNKQVLEAYLGE